MKKTMGFGKEPQQAMRLTGGRIDGSWRSPSCWREGIELVFISVGSTWQTNTLIRIMLVQEILISIWANVLPKVWRGGRSKSTMALLGLLYFTILPTRMAYFSGMNCCSTHYWPGWYLYQGPPGLKSQTRSKSETLKNFLNICSKMSYNVCSWSCVQPMLHITGGNHWLR